MNVLISGAGVAGPALAWFLAKAGARITVVEKAPGMLAHGQNVDIQGSARVVMKRMGLLDEVLRYNTTEKGTRFIDASGRPFAPLPVAEGKAASFSSQFEILRGDMAKILYEASKGFSNVQYKFGTTVEEVIINDDKSVKVSLSNGEEKEYDVLVAADGQWSKIRRKCFPKDSITVVDKGMYAAYFTIPRKPGDDEWWNIYHALASRIVTLRPDPHGTTRAMFTIVPRSQNQKEEWESASRKDRKTQEELCRKEFANAGWQSQRILDEMSAAPDFYLQAIQQIKMSTWSNGRVVLLGDAGYAPTPLTGMGTSLAILGAYVLGGELGKLKPGEHPKVALEKYEELFRGFVEESQYIYSPIPSIVFPQSGWGRWTFQTFISAFAKVAATPWIANKFADEMNSESFKLPKYANF